MEDKWIERQTNGTFALGHAGGPGRPKRSTEENYLEALSEQVTLKDWTEVVTRALDDGKAGDSRARDWLSRYLISERISRLDVRFDTPGAVRVLEVDDWYENAEVLEKRQAGQG